MAGGLLFRSLSSEAPPPLRIGTTHVQTWAYDDACNGGAGASATLVDEWLTYAESSCGPESLTTKALSDCISGTGRYCTPVAYVEANWAYAASAAPRLRACDPVPSSAEPETWWQHAPGDAAPGPATRVTKAAFGGTLLNQSTPAVRAWFAGYVRSCLGGYPALLMDDTAASLPSLLFGATGSFTRTREIGTDAQLVAAHRELAAALTRPDGSPFVQIDNGISANPSLVPPFPLLNHPRAVRGLVAEGAPLDNGQITPDATGAPDPAYYATLLDEIAQVDNAPADDMIVLLSYAASAPNSARLIQQATVMLGYRGDHVVDWADLEMSSPRRADLAVWPEEGIVPTDPLQSMGMPGGPSCLAGRGIPCRQGGHLDLQVPGAPGIYRREFRGCYDRGRLFGACAAIVNDTAQTRTIAGGWLSQSYPSLITFSGQDVESGGTVNVAGAPFAPGTTTIGPWSALLLSGARR